MSTTEWTREKPTKPGWYWTIDTAEIISVKVISEYFLPGEDFLVVDDSKWPFLSSTKDYDWWFGPIKPPEPPN